MSDLAIDQQYYGLHKELKGLLVEVRNQLGESKRRAFREEIDAVHQRLAARRSSNNTYLRAVLGHSPASSLDDVEMYKTGLEDLREIKSRLDQLTSGRG